MTLRFLITWVLLFFVTAIFLSAIAGLGTIEIAILAAITGTVAFLVARRQMTG